MNVWHSDDGRLRAGWRFVLGCVAAYTANFIAIGIAESATNGRMPNLEAIYRPTTLILVVSGFLLLLTTVDQVDEYVLRAMGIGRSPGWLRQAGAGVATGAGLIVIAVIWIVATGHIREISFSFTLHTAALGALELFILATAAMGEELMFRGYPFHRLLETVPKAPAVVIMSVLFAAAHADNPHASKLAMVNTFAIAVLLSVAYLRTGALWMSWGIHFAWNTVLGLGFGLPVSGLSEFAVIVRTQAQGPRWVTGGDYGIEGSVVGTIVILLGFVPMVLLTRRSAPARSARDDMGGRIELKIED